MSTRKLLLIALCLLSLGSTAQTYRWTDGQGRTVISDTPPGGKPREVSKDNAKAIPDDGLSFATRLARDKFPVTLYTGAECSGPCQQGKELLAARKVPFTEKAVQKAEDIAELKQLAGDAFVPTLKVGRQHIRGFDAERWHAELDSAGYPPKAGGKP